MNALSVAHTLRLSSLEGVDVYFNTDRTIVETNLLPTAKMSDNFYFQFLQVV